jgi:hypothetical protein
MANTFSTKDLEIKADKIVILSGKNDTDLPEDGDIEINLDNADLAVMQKGINGGFTGHVKAANCGVLTIPFILGSSKFIELQSFFKQNQINKLTITTCDGYVVHYTGIMYSQAEISMSLMLAESSYHKIMLRFNDMEIITKAQ